MLLRFAAVFVMAGVWATAAPPAKPHVVFVTGDDEYRSEVTMPLFARLLEAKHGVRTTVLYARPTPQTKTHIEGLEALASADLAVFFLRWRELPEPEMRAILDYAASGKPILGLRTSTHIFQYPKGSPHEDLNLGFPREVFGAVWTRHHGHESSTDVTLTGDHAVLRGVARAFHVRSWLYEVNPLAGDSTPVASGRALNPQGKDASPQPVAWVKTHKGGRVFFTTMGHPDDFTVPSMRTLLVNAMLWALGREVPSGGGASDFLEPYSPPPTR